MNIKITCCKKSVIVKNAESDELIRATKLFGFSSYQEHPTLKFYESAAGGMESEYTATIEPTDEDITTEAVKWG